MAIVFADHARRVFLIESRDRSYLHIVHPADPKDRRVLDGLVTAGVLICDGCDGGRFRGTCHAVRTSEEALRAAGQSAVQERWFDAAPGELQEAYGK